MCTCVLKCIFLGRNYFGFSFMAADKCGCCFMLSWLLIRLTAALYFLSKFSPYVKFSQH